MDLLPKRLLLLVFAFSLAAGVEAQQVTVAVFDGFSPVSEIDEDGRPTGLMPELLYRLLDDIGYEAVAIPFSGFAAAYQAVLAGEVDIMQGIVHTAERAELLTFNEEPFMLTWSEVFTLKDNQISSVFDLGGRRIAGGEHDQNAANLMRLLDSFDIDAELILLPDTDDAVELLRKGDVDALVSFSLLRRSCPLSIGGCGRSRTISRATTTS